MKDYRVLEANLIQNEKNRCDLLKNVCFLKQNQKVFINSITSDFIEHFKNIIHRIPFEINELIFNMFLGFKITPLNAIRVRTIKRRKY
jgi:hypothetical protein